MVCANCGKEMTLLGQLTEKESEDFQYVVVKESNINQALDTETINQMEFSESQVYEYFRAVFEARAEMEFLKFTFFKNLKLRLGLQTNEELWLKEDYTTGIVYIYQHPQDE